MNYKTGKEQKVLNQQTDKVLRKEQKMLSKKTNQFIKNKTDPIQQNLMTKIPPKVLETFDHAFYKAFEYLFEKGSPLLEKTYSKTKIMEQSSKDQQELNQRFSHRSMIKMDWNVNKKIWFNKGVSTVEGGAFGLVGIGLPDIPIFLSMLLKSVYEICLYYGFSYESEQEKIYLLNIICTAVSTGQEKQLYSAQSDRLSYQLDSPVIICGDSPSLQEMIRQTSHQLSKSLLLAKAIQGMPIIGVTGAAVNYRLMHDVSKTAALKYKKRFLNKHGKG